MNAATDEPTAAEREDLADYLDRRLRWQRSLTMLTVVMLLPAYVGLRYGTAVTSVLLIAMASYFLAQGIQDYRKLPFGFSEASALKIYPEIYCRAVPAIVMCVVGILVPLGLLMSTIAKFAGFGTF